MLCEPERSDSITMTLTKMERHQHILKVLDRKRKIIVTSVAEECNVTPETIRRDLTELEEQQLITRIHGGAVRFMPLRKEPQYIRKMEMEKEAKRQIAKVAASRVKDNETIAIDVGTTTVHIADFIVGLQNVTVVTNSITAAERFNLALEEKRMTGKVVLLGGTTNPSQASVSGAMTLEWLSQMNVDKVFLSCGGVDQGIVYDYDLDESLVSAKMIEQSTIRILLSDCSKVGQKSFFSFCTLNEITEIITNQACPDEWFDYANKWTDVTEVE